MKLVHHHSSPARALGAATAGLAIVVSTAACGGEDTTSAAGPAAVATTTSPAAAVTIDDAWVRAADTGMTAAFGIMRNTTDTEVRIVAAASPASTRMELHEVVPGAGSTMQMRPKAGGIVLPPGGTHELSPGGDHLMFMSLTTPIRPGDDIAITLTTATGATIPVMAPGRAFTGGNEEYVPGAGGVDMGGGAAPAPSTTPTAPSAAPAASATP